MPITGGGIIGGTAAGLLGRVAAQQIQADRSGRRRIIFVNLTTGQEVVLPVTPQQYVCLLYTSRCV